QVTHPHCAMVRWFCRRRIIFGSAQIAGQFARQLGDMTNVGARTPAGCCTGPELRTPGAAPQTRMVSVARIRLGSWESARAFKGIICDDVSEFESYMPSQPVRSPEANMRTSLKTARYRGNAIIGRLAASYRWRHSWQHAIESHTATNPGFIPGGGRSRVFPRSPPGTLAIRPAVRGGRERRQKIVVATRAAKSPSHRAQAMGRGELARLFAPPRHELQSR